MNALEDVLIIVGMIFIIRLLARRGRGEGFQARKQIDFESKCWDLSSRFDNYIFLAGQGEACFHVTFFYFQRLHQLVNSFKSPDNELDENF